MFVTLVKSEKMYDGVCGIGIPEFAAMCDQDVPIVKVIEVVTWSGKANEM